MINVCHGVRYQDRIKRGAGDYSRRVGIGILFVFLFSVPARSQTPCALEDLLIGRTSGTGVCRYVSATGSNSNDGLTRATPKQTIATTVNASNPGDEIIVLAGLYNCANQPGVSPCLNGPNSGSKLINITASGTAANPILVTCDSYLACKIDGSNNSTSTGFEIAGNYITVQNFEIEGFSDNGWENFNGGTYATLRRNWIHDEGRYCTTTTTGRDGAFVYYGHVIITQNLISDIGRYAVGENGCTSSLIQNDHGIYLDGELGNQGDVTISDNIFYRCERGYSIQVYPGTWTNISILNNTFLWSDVTSGASGGQIVVDANVTNLLIENNISYQPNQYMIFSIGGTVTGTYANNLVYGASNVTSSVPSGFTVAVTGTITNTDPKLVNVGSSVVDDSSAPIPDAHLTADSPAIKAGLTLATVPLDFAGTPRIPGAYDIGSYASRTRQESTDDDSEEQRSAMARSRQFLRARLTNSRRGSYVSEKSTLINQFSQPQL